MELSWQNEARALEFSLVARSRLQALLRRDDNNWGRFMHDLGADSIEGGATGLVNMDIENSSNETVTFSGALQVKGKIADLYVEVDLEQDTAFETATVNRSASGNGLRRPASILVAIRYWCSRQERVGRGSHRAIRRCRGSPLMVGVGFFGGMETQRAKLNLSPRYL